MRPDTLRLPLGLILLAAICAGCGDDSETAPSEKSSSEPVQTDSSEQSKEPQADPILTPDAAVQAVIGGLIDDDPVVLWDALPSSYQQDINNLLQLYAENVDPEVFAAFSQFMRRLAAVARDKYAVIMQTSAVRSWIGDSSASTDGSPADNWKPITDILDTIADSSLVDHQKLKQFDGREFLTNTGRPVMRQLTTLSRQTSGPSALTRFKESLTGVTVSVVSIAGDQAEVNFSSPGSQPFDMQMVLVEGKWIPADIAAQWELRRDELAAAFRALPQQMSQQKPSILQAFQAADLMLTVLEKSETPQQLDEVIGNLTNLAAEFLARRIASEVTGPDSQLTSENDPDAIKVIIPNAKESDRLERHIEKLQEAGQAEDGMFYLFEGQGVFEFRAAEDMQKIVEAIDFGEVSEVDAAARRITVRLKRQP